MNSDVAKRSVAWIRERFGPIGDLPNEVASVVWVTVYRSLEISMTVEREGKLSLMKDMLLGGGQLMRRFDEATREMDFLLKMVPLIRKNPADGQLLVDMLKWGIIDAADMSGWRRALARRTAKADPMYSQPVPREIL